MVLYKAIRRGLQSRPFFIKIEKDYVPSDTDGDCYESLFYYTEEQIKACSEKNTLSGIKDTITNRLYFDFDSPGDLELAKCDVLALTQTLLIEEKVPSDAIGVFFSGSKGFCLEVYLDEYITPSDFRTVVFNLAKERKTFDRVVNDANRIVRLTNTKHQKSGLYRIPLTINELENLNVSDIKDLATKKRTIIRKYSRINVRKPWLAPLIRQIHSEQPLDETIDFNKKLDGWPNCKFALLHGYEVKPGNRNDKLMVIIAHAKYRNYSKNQAYYLAKAADESGARRYGGKKCSKTDLWSKIEHIYSGLWNGGVYSCKDGKTPWLTELCQSLGNHRCKHETDPISDVESVFAKFQSYALDIDKNTIKTGIKELDKHVRIVSGQMVGILGAPSSGKTALALEILEYSSKAGILSVFYSLDMATSELFQKIAQRVTGLKEAELYEILKTGGKRAEDVKQRVCSSYSSVHFSFATGISVEQIEKEISDFENRHTQKVKLLLLDYNELLSSPYSDPTASGGYNAGQIKKLTNSRDLVCISLLQPPKVVGDASDEITSYRSIKGSSLLEQSFSIIIGIFRPGFSPDNNCDGDNFMVMNILKNRLGKLYSFQFYWDGLRGKIESIDQEGLEQLHTLRESKRQKNDSFD